MTGILITVDQLRGFIPDTAETDETLQMRIDDLEAEINRRFGTLTLDESEIASVTETVRAPGLSLLRLTQEPAEIVSVSDWYGASSTVIDVDDGVRIRGQDIELTSGGRWGERTVVEYVPLDARGRRRQALIKLIQLDMNYQPGLGSQSGGPWNESYFGKNYAAEREEIFATIGGQVLFA